MYQHTLYLTMTSSYRRAWGGLTGTCWIIIIGTTLPKTKQEGAGQPYPHISTGTTSQWAKFFHRWGKIHSPLFLGVYIVCEHPLCYYKGKCKEKICKSLYRKKLDSYFQSEPGSEPTDLQNVKFLQTYA